MKLVVLFWALGSALALPQSFFWTFSPLGPHGYRWNDRQTQVDEDPTRPSQLSRNPFPLHQRWPYHQEDSYYPPEPETDEDAEKESDIEGRKKSSTRQNVYNYNALQANVPVYGNSNRVIVTLYEFAATVSTTVSIPVVTTCIPLASFKEDAMNVGTSATSGCAVGRKRRGLWTLSEPEESIAPSDIETVEPTAAQLLPSADGQNGDPSLDSSQEEFDQGDDSARRKRQVNRRRITVIITTQFTSSTYTLAPTVSTLTQYSSFSCLPPQTVVCSK